MEALAEALAGAALWPDSHGELAALIENLPRAEATNGEDRSETTLCVACGDRERGTGFGCSWGDSSLVVVGFDREASPLHPKNSKYVSLAAPQSLRRERAECFDFGFAPGELVLGFTDGVDECHYRRPKTSVQPRHLQDLLIVSSGEPQAYATALIELALAGVDGNPGGEDNIAVLVSAG